MSTLAKPKFKPVPRKYNYTPTQSATISAGQTASLVFRGLEGKRFGFNRMTFGCNSPEKLRVKAVLNNELTIFEGVHVSALRNLFLQRSLLSYFVIRENNDLTLEITNDDAVSVDVNVSLQGLDFQAMDDYARYLAQNKIKPLEPTFFHGYTTVTALQTDKQVSLIEKARDAFFTRVAVGSDGISDIRVSLEILNDTVKAQVFAAQLNDEFLAMPAIVPYEVGKRIPVNFYVSNKNGLSTRNVSFICEAYFKN